MHDDAELGMTASPVLLPVNPHVRHAFIHLSDSVLGPARTTSDDPKDCWGSPPQRTAAGSRRTTTLATSNSSSSMKAAMPSGPNASGSAVASVTKVPT